MKGANTMYGYTMEMFEIMGDAMEDLREWQDYEADTLTNPWDD